MQRKKYLVLRVCPGVWFADVMTSFSGVTFVLFCFVFVSMLPLKPRLFVQSPFDMQAPRYSHTHVDIAFSESFFLPFPLSLCMGSILTYVVRSFLPDRMVFFYLVTTGWICDISL